MPFPAAPPPAMPSAALPATPLPAAPSAAQVLQAAAGQFPQVPCVTDLDAPGGPQTLTYAQLARRVAAVAGVFLALGAQPGDRVALLLPNGLAYVECFLGAAAAGLVTVPLNVRLLGRDYQHMLTDSGSRILVTTGEFLDRAPGIAALRDQSGLTVIRADQDGTGPSEFDRLVTRAEPCPPVSRDPSAAASLMYTSGTTGLPKAVVLSDRSWFAIAERSISVLHMTDGEVTLHVAPLTHGAGFLLLPTLMLGGHNLLCRSFDAARTLRIFADDGVTGLFLVPSMIRMLLDARPDGWTAPPALRRLYYAGSPIDAATLREATEAFGGRIVQSFAQMESPMFFTVLDEADHQAALRDSGSALVRSAGKILPGVELRIAADGDQAIAEDQAAAGPPGEILARAPQTMNGYWNRPQATAAALAGGWLHTGDVGYLDGDGYLYIVDRKKDMIVTGGSNVYAREVEEALLEIPAVRDAAVIGIPHRIWGEAVTAVLVPAGADRDSEAVMTACRARLAGYRVPKRIEWVTDLPRNAYGKVLKHQLRERFSAEG
jgi:acyl-CoA synthetase (AMP-forming)/AMP-acid ligase II